MLWTVPFAALPAPAAFPAPADVTVGRDDLVLTMDLPGLTADDVQIEVAGGCLCVRGERRRPVVAEGSRRVHAERAFGRFERRVALPAGVDPSRMTVTMDHGVLSLILPRAQRLATQQGHVESGTP